MSSSSSTFVFFGAWNGVEMAHRRSPRAHFERCTLRGFIFPPCLPDMVVVDVQNMRDSDLAETHETSHMLITALETLPSSPHLKKAACNRPTTSFMLYSWTAVISGTEGDGSFTLPPDSYLPSYPPDNLQEWDGHRVHLVSMPGWRILPALTEFEDPTDSINLQSHAGSV